MNEEALVAFARDLVAIPTENPPGTAYDECVARISAELETCGLDFDLVETGHADHPRTSLMTKPVSPGPFLYLHGHYDVVPAFSPAQFDPRVEEGRLIGRGSADMKGGIASMVYGARAAADRDVGVALVIVPDEETGGRSGAEQLATLGLLDEQALGAILAEPTWGTVWHASRGALTLRVTVHGQPAHVGHHYEGVNAFELAVHTAALLRPLQHGLRQRVSQLAFSSDHPRAGESILLIGGLSGGGSSFNVVPESFSFTIDRRPNADENFEYAKDELEVALESARGQGIELEWEILQEARGSISRLDVPVARALGAAVESITGGAPAFTCCPGVLETRVYHGVGIPAFAFGPGLPERMHMPDEDVPIANLEAAAAVYAETAALLAGESA